MNFWNPRTFKPGYCIVEVKNCGGYARPVVWDSEGLDEPPKLDAVPYAVYTNHSAKLVSKVVIQSKHFSSVLKNVC